MPFPKLRVISSMLFLFDGVDYGSGWQPCT